MRTWRTATRRRTRKRANGPPSFSDFDWEVGRGTVHPLTRRIQIGVGRCPAMSLDRYHSQFFAILYHEFREMYWRQDPGSRAVWDGVAHQRTLRDEFANAEFFGLAEYPAYILCIFNRLGHGPPDREAQLQIMDMRRDYVRRLLEQGNLPECQCDVAEDTIRVR